MKKCIICDTTLEVGKNWKAHNKKNWVYKCETCSKMEKKVSAANKRLLETPEEKKALKSRSKKHRDNLKKHNPKRYTARQMYSSATKRAKKKGLECNLTSKFIESICVDKCNILKVDLIYGGADKHKYVASLDRINPDKGYTADNVWVVSNIANLMKSNASIKEIEMFGLWCKKFTEKLKGRAK